MGKYTGWKNIWKLYPRENLVGGLKRPFIICLFLWLGFFFTSKSGYEMAGIISGMIVSAFPSIIGFILAGYTILIGCSNVEIMKKICATDNKKDSSIFQRTSATFAVVMGALIFTMLCGFVVNFSIQSGFEFWFDCGASIFNMAILILLSYLAIYSIWSLIDITSNVFNYSQFINAENRNKPEVPKGFIDKVIAFLSTLRHSSN